MSELRACVTEPSPGDSPAVSTIIQPVGTRIIESQTKAFRYCSLPDIGNDFILTDLPCPLKISFGLHQIA